MISAKIHKNGREILLAACDSILLGKTINLENGAKLKISESFYKEKEVSKKELIEDAKNCTTANFLGKETISALIESGTINKESVMDLNGIPHSQLYKMI
ncbi:MAG: DUF424 family protein [Candidatus Nanoarchaeia archaeon]|nr:DUF424 family protein [Candidatus Nanoarchaeia archaeon]